MKLFKKIGHFLDAPAHLITVFVVLMLVPNMGLAITEPYTATTIIASLLIPAGFYLLWTLPTRHPGIMMLAALPLMILGAFQLVLLYLFGDSIIAVDMFTNLFTTNVSEAGELLGNIYPAIIGVCIIYIPLIFIAIRSIRRDIKSSSQQRIRIVLVGATLLVAGGGSALISAHRNSEFGIKYHIFPVNVIHNIQLTIHRWHKSQDFPQTSKEFRFHAVKGQQDSVRREVYVMVIGEASRAASWQLFGYERETTPRLSQQANLVAFRDILTQSNTTHKSVPIILSGASAENFDSIWVQKSMLTLFKEAGFRTVFISNQPPNRSLIDFFANEADTTIDITSHNSNFGVEHLDEEVIPILKKQIASSDDNLFVVIHTYGSHFAYFKRYSKEFAQFKPDYALAVKRSSRQEVINSYDNSILYTDYVLSKVIATLDNANVCSALLYCADHGEDLMDDRRYRFLHASPTTTYYQLHVAAFAWFSNRYRSVFPEKYVAAMANRDAAGTTGNLFHTIADMASIESRYVDPSRSLVNAEWQDAPRMYLNDHDHAVDFLDTGLTEEDILMLDRHEIKYDKKDLQKIRY